MSHTARLPALLCFVLCLLLGLPLSSDALGLGDIQVRSSIGQKLDAEIEFSSLTAAEADSLTIRLASPELFAQTGIDYISALRSLRFTVEKKGDRPVIRLTSEMPISEPFLNVLIELNAAGSRTLRQYALLLDPPSLIEPPVVPAADTVTSPVVPAKTTPESAANASAATRSDKKEKAVNPGVGTTADTPPVKADTHTVRRGETLAAIATARRNEGVSVEQMMIALYRTNPQAFIGNNINRLKSGVELSMPDPDLVRVVDPVRARALIREQHAGFQRYREQLARYNTQPRDVDAAATLSPGRTEASSRSGVRSSSGSITAPVQEASGPPPVAQDKLKLGMPARDAAPTAGQQDALNQIATDKALAEANARIAALEKNISDLQQLAELRSKAPSDEPAGSVGSAPPEPPPSPARMPPSSGVTPALPATAVPPPAADNSWRPGDLPDWVRQSPLIPAGGVAVMLLLLIAGLLRYRRRRQTVPEGALMVEDVQSVLEQAGGGRHIDTSNSVFHSNFVPSVSQLDTNEVDAVAEADVYIAYGRDEQAEEILQEALRLHPERHALRVKLLEIYASRKDRQKFGNLAAELRVMTHGAGDAWSQAAQMGRMLDPGNLLYGAVPQDQSAPRSMTGAVQPTLAQKTVEAGTASTPVSPVEDFELSLEGLLGDPQSHIHPTGKATARQPASQNDRSADMPAAVPVGGDANTLAFERPDSMLFSLQGASPVRPTVNPVGFPGAPADVAAMQTKLDLAIACEEIGDNEGARELLTEVAGGPDTTLARRAQSLLSQLA